MKIKTIAAIVGGSAIVGLGTLGMGAAGASGSGASSTQGVFTQPSVPSMTIGNTASFVPVGIVLPTAPTTLGTPSASPPSVHP